MDEQPSFQPALQTPYPHPKKKLWIVVALVVFLAAGGLGWRHFAQKHIAYVPPAKVVSCLTTAQAAKVIGQTGCVSFTAHMYTAPNGQFYLDENPAGPQAGFSAWLSPDQKSGSVLAQQYDSHKISVTGAITSFKDRPQVQVNNPSQIQTTK